MMILPFININIVTYFIRKHSKHWKTVRFKVANTYLHLFLVFKFHILSMQIHSETELSPLFLFLLKEPKKQVILFLHLFFCNPFWFDFFKNGFIKGLLKTPPQTKFHILPGLYPLYLGGQQKDCH